MSRLLGLDHGTRRIGVAVADAETGMAFARAALRVPVAHAVEAAAGLAAAERIDTIVIGIARAPDGGEGSQAGAARAFGEALAAQTGLPVIYVDERLTSWEAAERLAAAGRRPERESGELDSAAARLILQDYLDARRAPRSGHASGSGDRDDQEVG